MKVDEQLQARILTFVIREFIDNKRPTPRRDLILAFEAEDISTALAGLTSHSLLRRKDNVFPEHYLPSAASFQFCDDESLSVHPQVGNPRLRRQGRRHSRPHSA